mgnify:CR=1 FL=1
MNFRYFFIATFTVLGLNAHARDFVSLKGSSTVFPFATIVAEAMGKNPKFKTPVVESGGSSVGKKGVCEGTGTKFVDIGNASSRMKKKELVSSSSPKICGASILIPSRPWTDREPQRSGLKA